MKTHDPALLPGKCRLWSKVESRIGKPRRKRDTGPASKEFDLSCRDVARINSALSDQTDVSQAAVLVCNTEPQRCFNGQFPRYEKFIITPDQAAAMITADDINRAVVFPFMTGQDLLKDGEAQQWVIDFQKRDILESKRFSVPFAHVEREVLPHVNALAQKERQKTGRDAGQDQQWLKNWWQHFRCRKEFVDTVTGQGRYIVCSAVTKRPVFSFLSTSIRPDHALYTFAFADDYSFGLLQSSAHWLWFTTKCGKLTERYRYSAESVYDTFPWPQAPTKKAMKAVAAAGCEVRRIRAEVLPTLKGGLRELYRTLELPGKKSLKDAHATLDAAVLAAYGFHPGRDLLAQLLALNQEVAAQLARGEAVTAPACRRDSAPPNVMP